MIETKKAKSLISKYSTPFYVFDEDAFTENYFHLKEAFTKEYKRYKIAYSFKTNYTPYICELVRRNKGFAEVVSDMELSLAYRIGYKPEEIIYNGPFKGKELEDHILRDGIANLDCEEEVDRIIELSKKTNKLIKIGLRLNFDIGANYTSRFGFDIEGDSFLRVLRKIEENSNVRVSGIHCHISRARGLDAWKKRIETLLRVSSECFDDEIDYIDIGSGMFGDMNEIMKEQFTIHIPSYEEYASVVGSKMQEHFQNKQNKPLLISEPGTTVISRYVSLFTKVIQIKQIKGIWFATVDASYQNAGEACKMKKLPYRIVNYSNNKNKRLVNIMGYTCLEQDCLYHDMEDAVEVGSIIEFENVGGYSIVYKPPFIRPNCSIIAVSHNHENIEIKKSESFNDIFQTYRFERTKEC